MKRCVCITLLVVVIVAVSGVATGGFSAQKRSKVKIESGTVDSPLNVRVSSMQELLPYLKLDYVNLVMEPGVYRITAADMRSGKYPSTSEIEEGNIRRVVMLVEGDHSTYDFTGVTMEIEAGAFTHLESEFREFINLQTLGNHNVIKNLKLVDIATRQDFPNKGCTNIMVDGSYNRLEGVELYSIGSSPYGYSDLFGKGRGAMTRLRKHCGCLVRGDYNHLLNCKVIHRGFGHCIFMQGADHPVIEGCYVEGEMRTTDEMLAEVHESSLAKQLNYMTTFGYRIPEGYTLACTEEGIRAYIRGSTMINGERYQRATTNVTVKDCYVKNARGGIILTHASGFKIVENCTVIGCQSGYSVGTGKIINCRADTQYGQALGVAYARDKGTEADITLLPNADRGRNGSKQIAYIIGSNHKIRFRRGEGLDTPEEDLRIVIGGDNKTIGQLAKDENSSASNIEIINDTGYRIEIDDNTSSITGTSRGEVVDNGVDNEVRIIEK